MAQCPYCNNPIQDGTRFCLSCGRQLDAGASEEVKSGGISDLKHCFGSFPVAKLDCYLCADQQQCANFSACAKQDELISKFDKIDNVLNALSKINNALDKMNAYLNSINNGIDNLASKLVWRK